MFSKYLEVTHLAGSTSIHVHVELIGLCSVYSEQRETYFHIDCKNKLIISEIASKSTIFIKLISTDFKTFLQEKFDKAIVNNSKNS